MKLIEWLTQFGQSSSKRETKLASLAETHELVLRSASDLRDMAQTICGNATETITSEIIEPIATEIIDPILPPPL